MNLADARFLLGLKGDASLEEIKRSYRALAFKYHPDLNTADPQAKKRFQRLNEAYLLLKQMHAESPAGSAKKKEPRQGAAGKQTGEEPKAGAWKKAKAAYTAAGKADSEKTNYYFRREEVLQDLLKDPFARQVFEDIYRELRKSSPPPSGPASASQGSLGVRLGKAKMRLDFSGGLSGALKALLLRQLDDEQTVTVPPTSLMPGTKLKIGVSQGLSGEPRTVEFTLPKDYVLGNPIRLKGLGRSIGPWKGDLYLRLTLG